MVLGEYGGGGGEEGFQELEFRVIGSPRDPQHITIHFQKRSSSLETTEYSSISM